jgi:ABC-type branched-subunit amino acid transport system ATPase component
MGEVFKAKDLFKGRRMMMIDEAVQDLSPGVRDAVRQMLRSWEGEASERRLSQLLGDDEAKRILKKMKR